MESEKEGVPREKRGYYSKIAAAILEHPTVKKFVSERMLLLLLVGLAFLLPVFFIPGGSVAIEFSKMVLLEVIILLGIFIWSAERLRAGRIILPKSLVLLTGFLLVIQFIASAIASPTPVISFIGSGYDLGTVNSFIVLFLLLFLSTVVFSTRDRILLFYGAILGSGALLALYHLARYFFGADFLGFGVFTSAVSTPAGKWNDLVSILGSVLLLSLVTQYFFPRNSLIKFPSHIIFAVSLFFLFVVDFKILWYILFVVTGLLVVIAIYEGEVAYKKQRDDTKAAGTEYPRRPMHKRVAGHLPISASILLLIAFVYMSGIASIGVGKSNTSIRGLMTTTLKTPVYSEVVLDKNLTVNVVAGSLKDSILFGSGPNRFGAAFLEHKISDINRTPFWNTTFDYGLGQIPTYFGTTGTIGILLWTIFLVLLLIKVRPIFRMFSGDRVAAYLGTSLFLLTVYFWSLAFFYLPGVSVFALAFMSTGTLIAFLVSEKALGVFEIGFAKNARLANIITPVIVIVLVGTVSSGVLLSRQILSLVAFRDAQRAVAAGNIEQAEANFLKANEYSERDAYHRALSNVAIAKLQRLPNEQLNPQDIATKANQYIGDARTHAERAITLDPTNSENYLQLGSVYDALGFLGIQNTSGFARENYDKALALNPKSPRLLYLLARLEYAANNKEASEQYLERTLAERPNYFEALSFYVQFQLAEGNTAKPIDALTAGLLVEPGNFLLHFALGYLYYGESKFSDAIREFEAAVAINPVYADAKYFLGLSYEKSGRHADAISQFTDVQTLNPDNKDVTQLLKNLRAGRSAFSPGFTPSAGSATDALNELQKQGAR